MPEGVNPVRFQREFMCPHHSHYSVPGSIMTLYLAAGQVAFLEYKFHTLLVNWLLGDESGQTS